ncbi:MAG: hypothetical protein ABIO85_08650 [Sphingomicrobium sp.]
MNPFEMVVIIVAIVAVANVLKVRRAARDHGALLDVTPNSDESGENRRLRDEVTQLKQRVQVLERITIEKENSLEREIEQLRDR